MKKGFLKYLNFSCYLSLLFVASSLQAQVKNPFDIRYQDNIRGELTFIANNIVNSQTSSSSANTAYNFTGDNSSYNDDLNMQYIDIDGDKYIQFQ